MSSPRSWWQAPRRHRAIGGDGISLTYRGSGDQVVRPQPRRGDSRHDDRSRCGWAPSIGAEVYLVATNTAHHPMNPQVEQLGRAGSTVRRRPPGAGRGRIDRHGAAAFLGHGVQQQRRAAAGRLLRAATVPVHHDAGGRTRTPSSTTTMSLDEVVDIPATKRKEVDGRHHDADRLGRRQHELGNLASASRQDGRRDREPVPESRTNAMTSMAWSPPYSAHRGVTARPSMPDSRAVFDRAAHPAVRHRRRYSGFHAAADEPRTLGFFAAKDNYLRNSSDPLIDSSNERLLFYLDAPLLARPTVRHGKNRTSGRDG